jgi:hypothetical protein
LFPPGETLALAAFSPERRGKAAEKMSSQKKRSARIEPFRHRVETDPKFFEKSWTKLHDAIREIYNHNASGLSFEELYRLYKSPARPCFFPSNFSC